MKNSMRADEIILDYAPPLDAMEEFLEFMGLEIDLDSNG
jgi:hypothetical protein